MHICYNWKSIQSQDAMTVGENCFESEFIVTNDLGGNIEPRTFKDYYNSILELAGFRHFTFHVLRHTFATLALQNGVDIKTVSGMLGHYSAGFTLDPYTHVTTPAQTQAASTMSSLLMQASGD